MRRLLLLLLVFLFPAFAQAELEVHFLDVGHGDCIIITCDGESAIIDGGISSCSQQVFNYIRNLNITDIKYAVASHPDADHIGGLPAAFHAANVHNLLAPVAEHDEKRFQTLLKTADEKHVPVTVSKAGDVFSLGNAQITILSPAISFADSNDLSLVLRLDYGKTSFIFTGDASTGVERDLIARKANLDADVLKVSHHGSSTGTSSEFVHAVSPQYAVISCAETNLPGWDVLYALAEPSTLITAQKGNIIIRSDEVSLTTVCERMPIAHQDDQFVGNANSKVFHLSICDSVSTMNEKNKRFFESAEQAESKGYRPCKNCSPKRK